MHIFLGRKAPLLCQHRVHRAQVRLWAGAALGISQEPLKLMGQSVFRDLSSSVCLQPPLSLSHTKPIRAHFLSIPTLCSHPWHLHISVLLLAAFWHTSLLSQSRCKGQQILSGTSGVPVTAAGAAPLAVTNLWWFCFEERWHLTASCI